MILRCALAALALALMPASLSAQGTKPQRIVSLNLCTDILLFDLVAPERIAALSPSANDPRASPIAERVQPIRRIRGEAEEVLSLSPDLVLAAEFTAPATISMLERLKLRVVKIPMAQDIAGVRTSLLRVAEATGDTEKARAAIAAFDARLARARAASAPEEGRPSAVIYQINGIVSGTGLLEDEALSHAGFRNLAPDLHADRGGRVSIEAIVAHPPDLLLFAGPSDEYRTVVADALVHPALRAVMHDRATAVLPWRDWICGTPYIADTIDVLADLRRRLAVRRPPA
ncbi:ABC transporter substrate-binding protein [Hyphomicrobium sp. CS1BSMeth3]|uniref:ABC transporter substrate-binding protein n=1 Tax=Hyphomicrobium sp. CS1BSMeth3 TaxID=1892844 RepID=UPI00093076F9|nr:ABC transporter substrate-binding protein [Hyphomicrobium sp. CS1BSMeth3]